MAHPSISPFDSVPKAIARRLGISDAATMSPAPQGMTSEVAFVDERDRQSVLKRCRNPIYVEWLRREHQVLVGLSDCALRIPRVLGYHEVHQQGRLVDAWLHMTRVPGDSLWGALLNSPAPRTEHLQKVGNLLRELHSCSPPAIFRHERSWIDRTLEQARNNLPWCDGSAELLATLDVTRPPPWPEVLIHGDLALDNALIDREGAIGLIDWSGGDLGDPRYDIALALDGEPDIQLGDVEMAAFFGAYGRTVDAATIRWFRRLYEFF